MSRNKSNRLQKKQLRKASNETAAVSRLRMSSMGTLALSRIQSDVERSRVEEMRWPQMVCTVEAMKQDATVAIALKATYTFVTKAFEDFKILHSESQESKDAAKFIEYCFKNMEGQTLRQFARSAATFEEYGFSVTEKVYTPIIAGDYAGRFKLKKLAFRPQGSLSRSNPFIYEEGSNEFLGVKQSQSAFVNTTNSFDALDVMQLKLGTTDVVIPANKLLVLNTDAPESMMMGVSPLLACYRAWREKILIENLEVVGATKDLGGIIELKIPSQILNKANIDPTSPEATMVHGLMQDAANAHSGEQAFFMLPSDVKEGAAQYSMTLKGIDGVGKQYSTQDLINQRKKSILDGFGAGFINLGNDKAGSYNLSESKQTIHSHFVQHVVGIITEGLNENVIPQILALNGIRLSHEDMPRIKAGLISEVDMEEFSKAVQRVGAVGYLPKTKEVVNKILEVMGIDYKVPEEMSQEEFLKLFGEDTSRSGDGMAAGTTGNGTSKISGLRDNSVSNTEN